MLDVTQPNLAEDFRNAMRRLTASVSLITTEYEGERYGMAVTAVISMGIAPPSLLISVSHTASMHDALLARGRFAVNILTVEQGALVRPFSGALKGAARFGLGKWDASPQGLPFLVGAQANLGCRVAATQDYSGHTIFIGELETIAMAERIAPLLYENGELARSERL
jgi:flavin reductase (DIM6/NTAB) family NADH-FMN oxidoreductase RutF